MGNSSGRHTTRPIGTGRTRDRFDNLNQHTREDFDHAGDRLGRRHSYGDIRTGNGYDHRRPYDNGVSGYDRGANYNGGNLGNLQNGVRSDYDHLRNRSYDDYMPQRDNYNINDDYRPMQNQPHFGGTNERIGDTFSREVRSVEDRYGGGGYGQGGGGYGQGGGGNLENMARQGLEYGARKGGEEYIENRIKEAF